MKFKYGVSDWKIIFDDGTDVLLTSLTKEDTYLRSDGFFEIILTEVSFPIDLINYFRKDKKIKMVEQHCTIRIQDAQEEENTIKTEKEIFYYENLFIESIHTHSLTQELGIVSICLESDI